MFPWPGPLVPAVCVNTLSRSSAPVLRDTPRQCHTKDKQITHMSHPAILIREIQHADMQNLLCQYNIFSVLHLLIVSCILDFELSDSVPMSLQFRSICSPECNQVRHPVTWRDQEPEIPILSIFITHRKVNIQVNTWRWWTSFNTQALQSNTNNCTNVSCLSLINLQHV